MGVIVKYFAFIILILAYGQSKGQIFAEKASELGIDHYAYDPNVMGGGVAIFDFNNDGFEDIYLTGGLNGDKLYENLGNGTFEDVTKKMQITALNIVKTMGVVAGDVDNDGFTDLFITSAENDHCYLLKNEGGNMFTDRSIPAGVTHKAWSSTATMGDYDLDGDLDIYVGNYVAFSELPFDQHITNAEADFFYQNDGTGHFTKIDNPLTFEKRGCTLVSSFSDIDLDGDADLFVLNDFGDFYQSNKLLLNDYPSPIFQEITDPSGMNAQINSMGIAVGDFDEDGNFDYYITNIGDNLLYQGLGEAKFKNVSGDHHVNDGTGVSWGTAFMDVNNDSYLDLFVVKGSILSHYDPQENKLYLRNAQLEVFEDVSVTEKVNEKNKARGMAYGDFNNDGWRDLVVANVRIDQGNPGKSLVYINESKGDNRWVKVSLQGVSSNKNAYGSIVQVFSGNRHWIREITAGSSYLSHHSAVAHIGLGDITTVDSMVVNWPGGNREVFKNLATNQEFRIVQHDNIYITTSLRMDICSHEKVFLQGALRNSPGIYRDTIRSQNDGIDSLRTTRLFIDDKNTGECVVTGTTDNITEHLAPHIYPNPFKNAITIHGFPQFKKTAKITLLNSVGALVETRLVAIKSSQDLIELHGYELLTPGVYLLKIEMGDIVYLHRLIKS
ncbi:FG-GAP-like repeat-containing protein [Fulvivirgaceae bacterium BMA12]|uniref:FG-GAP-like repeat-containing protein n=1 Tax=Agaribacillus aureus TaxID=3051825 RepID=A0ABT8LEP4_9BACT|nr:FG-GAP-like repeat-containing protein [Fulvivirgaceae bacterium BMA12]